MFRSLAASAALLGAITAAPAVASPSFEQVQGSVSYAGLDLSDQGELAELKLRLAREARKICTDGVDDRLRSGPDIKACRASVVASGKVEIARLVGRPPVD